MTTLDVLRLTALRELHVRPLFLLGPPLCALGLLAIPAEHRGPWAGMVIVFILPLAALGLGVGGSAAADRWWAGLGGSPAARAGARLGVHLLALGGSLLGAAGAALGSPRLDGLSPGELGLVLTLALVVLLGTLCLYLAASAARLFARGFGALVGPMLVGLLSFLMSRLDLQIGVFSALEGLALRLAGLTALGVGLLFWAEGRLLSARHGLAAVGLTTLMCALPLGLHAAWSGPPLWMAPTLSGVRPGGSEALYVLSAPAPGFTPQRAWRWREGAWEVVGPVGVSAAELGPEGSLGFAQGSEDAPGGLALLDPDGALHTCAFDGVPTRPEMVFRSDGRALAALVSSRGERAVAVVRADGVCERLPMPAGELRIRLLRREGSPEGVWAPLIAFDADGALVLGESARPLVEASPPAEDLWIAQPEGDALLDPRTGQRWPNPLPDAELWPALEPTPGGARAFFQEGPIYDLDASGARTCWPTTFFLSCGA